MMEQQQHFIFGEAKVKFETGPETGPLGDSVSVQDVADVLVSKMMWYDGNVKYFSIYAKYFLRYPGNMDFSWGYVDSVHPVLPTISFYFRSVSNIFVRLVLNIFSILGN